MSNRCDVAIVGAGPYGLSAAAHLSAAGREVHVFGAPMEFWQQRMPRGMLLRSSWAASHISDPRSAFTLDKFRTAAGVTWQRNVPLETFVRYGSWFQQNAVPQVDGRRVTAIERNGGFHVITEDGDSLAARRVVIATGLLGHEIRPVEFKDVAGELASHSCDHSDFSRFRNREVAVIGGGQSAIESAALLHECGARVEVIVRAPQVRWLGGPNIPHPRHRKWLRDFALSISPRSEVGPFPWNWLAHLPLLYRTVPRSIEEQVTFRALRPAAASWLYERTRPITITTGRSVRSACASGTRIRLVLDDGSERCFDHVLLATGYRIDLDRMKILARPMAAAIRTHGGSPVLSAGLESSVPGLHFVGATAAFSSGPLMRFVSGTASASHALLRAM